MTTETWEAAAKRYTDNQKRKKPLSKGNLGKAEFAQEIAATIRNENPNLSEKEIYRRANLGAGLKGSGEPVTQDSNERIRGGLANARNRAATGVKGGGQAVYRTVWDGSKARKVILGVVVFSVAISLVRDVQQGKAATTDIVARRLFASFIALILLLLLAGISPKIATGFAFLMGFSVLAVNTETIEKLTGKINQPTQTFQTESGFVVTVDNEGKRIGIPR